MRKRLPVLAAMVAALAVTIGSANVILGTDTKTWDDPDAGLTDAEQEAAQAENSAAFWTHYAEWVEQLNLEGTDPASYPTEEAMAITLEPRRNLGAAAKAADLIVEGDVTAIQFRSTADSLATIAVSRRVKGAAGDTVEVVLPNGLMPTDDWGEAFLAVVDGMPMIYPGDKVVLFLISDPALDGQYSIQAWTGTYWREEGRIRPTPGNPFATEVSKFSPATFRAAVLAALD